MNLPYPFNKASGVRADTEGTINLIDARGKALARVPMTTAFELSPEIKGHGHGGVIRNCDGSGFGGGCGYGSGDGSGYGSGFSYGSGQGDGSGSGQSE